MWEYGGHGCAEASLFMQVPLTRAAPVLPAGEEDGTAIEEAFSKKKVETGRTGCAFFVLGTFLDHTADTISYSDFVHRVSRGHVQDRTKVGTAQERLLKSNCRMAGGTWNNEWIPWRGDAHGEMARTLTT